MNDQEKADCQVSLSFQWAAKDSVKYFYFAKKLRSAGFEDLADEIEKIARLKQQRAFEDLDYLLATTEDPTFSGWDKAIHNSNPPAVTTPRDMVLSVIHSELDQSVYLYREVARKLADNNDDRAERYQEFSRLTKDNFKRLQKKFAEQLKTLDRWPT